MGDPPGEADRGALRLDFDRRLILQFRGSAAMSDAGLLAYLELHDTLGLSNMGAGTLADVRTGKNGRHRLVGLRQSVFGWLAGYEDVNDAERLRRDPAMRWVVGDRAITRSGASASQMGRFKARWRRRPGNLAAFADLPGQSIDKVHQRRPPKRIVLDMDLEPNLWREGNVPNGQRWRCVATDVRRHPVADRPAPGTTVARRHQMRQATTAEVRLDAVGAAPFGAAAWSTGGFERHLRATNVVAHCSSRSQGDHGLELAGNLANVG
jgi:hypothetical protein